jgi:hypothetical protein
MTIKGNVKRINIGSGFWGIIGENGEQWRPTNLPPSLQKEGKSVTLSVKISDEFSIFMWGQAVEVL